MHTTVLFLFIIHVPGNCTAWEIQQAYQSRNQQCVTSSQDGGPRKSVTCHTLFVGVSSHEIMVSVTSLQDHESVVWATLFEDPMEAVLYWRMSIKSAQNHVMWNEVKVTGIAELPKPQHINNARSIVDSHHNSEVTPPPSSLKKTPVNYRVSVPLLFRVWDWHVQTVSCFNTTMILTAKLSVAFSQKVALLLHLTQLSNWYIALKFQQCIYSPCFCRWYLFTKSCSNHTKSVAESAASSHSYIWDSFTLLRTQACVWIWPEWWVLRPHWSPSSRGLLPPCK